MSIQNNPLDYFTSKISTSLKNLENGLDPEILAYWYKRIEEHSIELVPTSLKEQIHFTQDRILWMKFNLNISKISIPYIIQSIDEYLELMPFSTALYFAKVSEILTKKAKNN